MRQERITQASLFDIFATHEIGRELKQISQWLDQHRPLLRLISNDLRRDGCARRRRGLPAEAVLRCALLKQYRQLSYEELAFHLEDLASFRAFARLPMGWTPKKAVLQKTISAITAASWEAINQAVVRNARQTRLEPATMVRIDSTVTEALMHEPSDSSLLWDAVRVMTRLLEQGCALAGRAAISWRDHRRLAKKRAHAIQHSRGKERKAKLYRELIAVTRATKLALERALVVLAACAGPTGSVNERYRPESGPTDGWNIAGGMPPAFRNHRVPIACGTPTSIASSSLGIPDAIAAQNRRCSSRPATGGRPGDNNRARPDRSERRFRAAIVTSSKSGVATTT